MISIARKQRATTNLLCMFLAFGRTPEKTPTCTRLRRKLWMDAIDPSCTTLSTISSSFSTFFISCLNSKNVKWFWFRLWLAMTEIMCVKCPQWAPDKFRSLCSETSDPFLMSLTTDHPVQQPLNWHFVLLWRASHERTVKSHSAFKRSHANALNIITG